jgi:hypothetical protein
MSECRSNEYKHLRSPLAIGRHPSGPVDIRGRLRDGGRLQVRRHASYRRLYRVSWIPDPLLLAWAAAVFESLLVLALLTGAFFSEAVLLAAAYVLFLAFAFHGPAHWTGSQAEFGFFIDHFTFIAGLLFAAANGPGRWALRRRLGGGL